jgi:putative ABC transport system ATP-binding protein
LEEQADTPVIEVDAVRYAWAGASAPAVAIDALRVARGEHVLLRGPSGSGKSTLLNLLAGVLTASAGAIRVLGQELGAMPGAARDRFRADHIGYIFQMFNLVPYLSVVENVCLPCRFSPRRRERAARAGGTVPDEARRLLRALDLGDDEMPRRPVTALSVGQQQRVAVARALVGAPELVIADEPTSALDAGRRAGFLELLFRQCERDGTTVVLASHDEALAPLFGRTVALGAAR